MRDREYFIAARLLKEQHDAVRLAADAKTLKVGEWVRLTVLGRLSGEDSVPLSLVREVLALRIILLNVLFYLGPAKRTLRREKLKEIAQLADESSAAQVQKLLSTASAPARAAATAGSAQQYQVGARLTATQYEELTLDAQVKQITATEWLRQAVISRLESETVLRTLKQQLLGLRLILEESVRRLTVDADELDRDTIAALTKRTAPAALHARSTNEPSRRNLTPGEN